MGFLREIPRPAGESAGLRDDAGWADQVFPPQASPRRWLPQPSFFSKAGYIGTPTPCVLITANVRLSCSWPEPTLPQTAREGWGNPQWNVDWKGWARAQHVEYCSGLLPVACGAMKSMDTQTQPTFSGSRRAVRLITLFNLLVFALFVIPPAHRAVDRAFLALRSVHFEEPAGYSLEIWLVGSTLAATVLLGRLMWRRRRAISAGLPSVSLTLETTLVAAWWLAALGACAYGFLLGMGG